MLCILNFFEHSVLLMTTNRNLSHMKEAAELHLENDDLNRYDQKFLKFSEESLFL